MKVIFKKVYLEIRTDNPSLAVKILNVTPSPFRERVAPTLHVSFVPW